MTYDMNYLSLCLLYLAAVLAVVGIAGLLVVLCSRIGMDELENNEQQAHRPREVM